MCIRYKTPLAMVVGEGTGEGEKWESGGPLEGLDQVPSVVQIQKDAFLQSQIQMGHRLHAHIIARNTSLCPAR